MGLSTPLFNMKYLLIAAENIFWLKKKRLSLLFISTLFLAMHFASICLAKTETNYTGSSGYRIRKIEIFVDNVFDPNNPDEAGALSSFGNALHVTTRQSVIRNELLLREGDMYDPLIIEESERNLRNLDYLAEVKIFSEFNHDIKTVDLFVYAKDHWSFIAGFTAGGTSENPMTGMDFGDQNFLGTGQSVSYGIRSDNSGTFHTIGFKDRTFLQSRYSFDMEFDTSKQESRFKTGIQQPFYSLLTKSSYGALYIYTKSTESDLTKTSKRANIFYGRSYGFHDDDILRALITFSSGELKLLDIFDRSKTTRDNKLLLTFNFLFDPYDFREEKYMEKFKRVEDIPMGPKLSIGIARSSPLIGATTSEFGGEISVDDIISFNTRDYLFSSFKIGFNDEKFNDAFYLIDLKYYWRKYDWHSLVLHTNMSIMESESSQLLIGGTKGLRGFKVDEFKGRKILLFNIEDRIFTYHNFFYGLFELGFVVFSDWGRAWEPLDELKNSDFHGSVGTGVRLALLKAPGISLIRIDIGFPVTEAPQPVLTLGMEGFF